MREVDEEIREIKKEIIESRGLIIKTNNLTNALAADIKSIAKRQAGYERRFNWNSWIAYILFATLSFVGLKLASDARIREIEGETEELQQQVTELRRELAEETRRAERRARAEAAAATFYRLVRERRRTEVVERWPELRREQLSRAEAAFFRDTVDRFHLDLSIEAYQGGLDLMRTGRYAEAAEAFQESIRLKEEAAHVPAVKFQLARACASSAATRRRASSRSRWSSRPSIASCRTTRCSCTRAPPRIWTTSTRPETRSAPTSGAGPARPRPCRCAATWPTSRGG
ncbi:MAG: hypothetical protein M5U28_26535 [Sandaracinaceae bacterium]|nr:hypothetical protein [Sandaracinaceae bacterium]